MPKTALGKRAAIEQANNLRLLNPEDPDQKYALLSTFGLSDLVPSLNIHVQAALQLQDAFERWVEAPQGPPPLNVKPWYDVQIHITERIKWLNTDKMRDIISRNPMFEQIVTLHLQQLQMLMAPPPMVGPDGKPLAPPGPGGAPGGGQAMSASNANAASTKTVPSGSKGAPNTGPQQMGPI